MPRPPLIAVTATTEIIRGLPRVRVNEAYTDALSDAGMIPVVVAPFGRPHAAGIIDRVDGLVLTGGEDIDPRRYSASPHPRADQPHDRRDASEIALVKAARAARLPTLAICRGLQIANVALGGTLVQDIPSERASSIDHSPPGARSARVHAVSIATGSRLAAATGATAITVNSSHHQAIDRVGAGLTITATAPDGIVEGAEWGDDQWWLLGLQWHPEELTRTAPDWDRAIFTAFRDTLSAAATARR